VCCWVCVSCMLCFYGNTLVSTRNFIVTNIGGTSDISDKHVLRGMSDLSEMSNIKT